MRMLVGGGGRVLGGEGFVLMWPCGRDAVWELWNHGWWILFENHLIFG